jgi:hypothetical protein
MRLGHGNGTSRFVLGLYRKRGWARSGKRHVVYERFRYSDMKGLTVSTTWLAFRRW